MWHWLTKHIDLILFDVLIKLLAYETVDNVNLYLSANLTLDQTEWCLTWTETWYISLLTIVLKLLLYISCEISLLNNECEYTADLLWIF